MIKSLKITPMVEFDPENMVHRLCYHSFITNRTWSKSKFRFVLEDTYIDVPSMINDKLIKHYLNREFEERQ
jgi:hypothetical protein